MSLRTCGDDRYAFRSRNGSERSGRVQWTGITQSEWRLTHSSNDRSYPAAQAVPRPSTALLPRCEVQAGCTPAVRGPWWLGGRIYFPHPQRRRAALPLGPVQPLERAQKDFFRAASLDPGLGLPVTGALSLLPVCLLYLARPLAVSPPPALTDCFSPRPTDRLGFFLADFFAAGLRFAGAITSSSKWICALPSAWASRFSRRF